MCRLLERGINTRGIPVGERSPGRTRKRNQRVNPMSCLSATDRVQVLEGYGILFSSLQLSNSSIGPEPKPVRGARFHLHLIC